METPQEGQFVSFDGTSLFYRSWIPKGEITGAIFLFHRGHEHSGRLIEFVEKLDLPNFAIFAWDARGHGKSPGERGYARHFTDIARDMDSFVRAMCTEHKIRMENTVVLGHSVAAVAVALWVHDYAPRVRAMILATPAFRVKLYVPGALTGLRVLRFLGKQFGWPERYIQSYVKGKMLTHDPVQAEGYNSDPLISKQIASGVLIDLFDVSKRLIDDAGAITARTLLLSARADWVVKNKPQRLFFNRLSSSWKEVEVLKDFFHAIFHEKDRDVPIAAVRRFVLEVFAKPFTQPDLTTADKRGYTKEEYQWLAAGLPMISAKRLMYRAQRYLMSTLGKQSEGIRIGWDHGFDSGQSLDYVYRNKPTGTNELGRLMDKSYLDSVGWRGIRTRRVHLEAAVEEALLRAKKERDVGPDAPLKFFDIAGGPGRYVLNIAQKLSATAPVEAMVRDWSEHGLEEGRKIALEMGVTNVTHLRGDAFDSESLAQLPKSSDVGIVSGLYELFPDNGMVLRSLAGVKDALRPHGFLIYTNQPWHPQLEMIAEVLLNRDGKPWVMRRRTQIEMDQLVERAGFVKERTFVDDDGIFTVSVARRV